MNYADIWTITSIFLALWIGLSYAVAFWRSANRFFLIHMLRWALIIQYVWLIAYLFNYNILPKHTRSWILAAITLMIFARKWLPMALNRYAEGPFQARDILFLQVNRIKDVEQTTTELWIPDHIRVDELYRSEVRTKIVVYTLLFVLNFLIMYGVVTIDKIT